ncbi:acyl carrier protein [Gemella sanguinis]|jgi:acyl carrier protein|uniref:Acyl carrier protein n=1 Tax=Gemella sanguinis TaxID=84135 RepID=A0A2N6SH65_9BACL|nr:acyl carrier protein [Gemella sanguinis]EGF87788.1 acyl carrier protein [Gemella sanguinis M325]NKZ25451.1 acyl carrier protein [Gemella sanguinis]PMC53275.1 acyl carrier protein [Gemella sanguinis]QGS06952.1 acyl carrier protein [Gemella sanguinis]
MAILEEVKEIITKYIKIDPERITLESRLNEDLDADSIDIADVVMDIEEKYGFEFSDEDAENIVAIKDLVKVIEDRK